MGAGLREVLGPSDFLSHSPRAAAPALDTLVVRAVLLGLEVLQKQLLLFSFCVFICLFVVLFLYLYVFIFDIKVA